MIDKLLFFISLSSSHRFLSISIAIIFLALIKFVNAPLPGPISRIVSFSLLFKTFNIFLDISFRSMTIKISDYEPIYP